MSIKRYDIETCDEYPRCQPMQESVDGDYVAYTDYVTAKARVRELEAELAALREENERLKEKVELARNDYGNLMHDFGLLPRRN